MTAAATIPRFALYGEPARASDAGFVHAETIASRSAGANWTIRSHRHADLHHLLVIASGGGELRADAARIGFGPGSVVVVPAGTVHGFAFAPETEGHIVTFATGVVDRLATPAIDALFAAARVVAIAAGVDLGVLVDETRTAAPLAGLAAQALLQTLLVATARASGPAPVDHAPSPAVALVARLRQRLDDPAARGDAVADHARALGTSPARLRAACLAVTGAPPRHLLRDALAAEARRQLVHTDRSVAAIGFALGFDDPAYFSRFFSARVGVAPARFRAAARALILPRLRGRGTIALAMVEGGHATYRPLARPLHHAPRGARSPSPASRGRIYWRVAPGAGLGTIPAKVARLSAPPAATAATAKK